MKRDLLPRKERYYFKCYEALILKVFAMVKKEGDAEQTSFTLTKLQFRGVVFDGVEFPLNFRFKNCDFVDCSFFRCNIKPSQFEDCKFSDSKESA